MFTTWRLAYYKRRMPENMCSLMVRTTTVSQFAWPCHLFPYFYNMLSEGSNRQVQSMLHHIDENDDFGIMLATAGHDTIGAVTIKPM